MMDTIIHHLTLFIFPSGNLYRFLFSVNIHLDDDNP
jgi:hypothetical protein